jgi:hypothetical protein
MKLCIEIVATAQCRQLVEQFVTVIQDHVAPEHPDHRDYRRLLGGARLSRDSRRESAISREDNHDRGRQCWGSYAIAASSPHNAWRLLAVVQGEMRFSLSTS